MKGPSEFVIIVVSSWTVFRRHGLDPLNTKLDEKESSLESTLGRRWQSRVVRLRLPAR
jgi:hypothetical protein